jgi:hypothetical protein
VFGGVGAENTDGGIREGGEAACGTTWGQRGGLRLLASRLPCAGEAVGEVRARRPCVWAWDSAGRRRPGEFGLMEGDAARAAHEER